MKKRNAPKWFTEDDIQYTKRLFGYCKPVAELYVKNYTKMMNECHGTDFTAEEYKEVCLNTVNLSW